MAKGWSIGGKRLTLKPGFRKATLLVDGQPLTQWKGSKPHPFQLLGHDFTIAYGVGPGGIGAKLELRTASGLLVPPTKQHVVAPAPAPGARCAQHSAEARVACARCGTFACAACTPDLTYCNTCFETMSKLEAKRQADMVLMAPAFMFIITGGALGALVGFGAGALSVRLARGIESKAMKWVVALAVYGFGFALWVLMAGAMQGALTPSKP